MAAATCLSVSFAFSLGFRRFNSRPQNPSISLPRAPALRTCRIGDGVGGMQVKRRLPKVFASAANPPPSPKADKGSTAGGGGGGGSNVQDGPPVATILAGIVVFLLFCWAVGSIVLWIIGLIVNVPSS